MGGSYVKRPLVCFSRCAKFDILELAYSQKLQSSRWLFRIDAEMELSDGWTELRVRIYTERPIGLVQSQKCANILFPRHWEEHSCNCQLSLYRSRVHATYIRLNNLYSLAIEQPWFAEIKIMEELQWRTKLKHRKTTKDRRTGQWNTEELNWKMQRCNKFQVRTYVVVAEGPWGCWIQIAGRVWEVVDLVVFDEAVTRNKCNSYEHFLRITTLLHHHECCRNRH